MKPPAGTRIILIRHAESEGNAGKIMQGAGEYPLSENGRIAAAAAAAAFLELCATVVASSDLSRAKETAMLAAGRVDLVDPRLRERGAGPWEGLSRAALEAAHPGALEDDTKRPDSFEPVSDVIERMRAACTELLTHDGVVAAFTHGAVMRLLDEALGGEGRRFAHLEGLCLDAGLRVIGRVEPLGKDGEV